MKEACRLQKMPAPFQVRSYHAFYALDDASPLYRASATRLQSRRWLLYSAGFHSRFPADVFPPRSVDADRADDDRKHFFSRQRERARFVDGAHAATNSSPRASLRMISGSWPRLITLYRCAQICHQRRTLFVSTSFTGFLGGGFLKARWPCCSRFIALKRASFSFFFFSFHRYDFEDIA